MELVIDNFAGGGGASTGIEAAIGRPVDYAINHDPMAMKCHQWNHPKTTHLIEDVFAVKPAKLCAGRPVGLAWFSPDCRHHSKAKGAAPKRDRKVRGLAWVAVKWADQVRPRIIVLENVEEFEDWGPLDKRTGKPDPKRKGQYFKAFCTRLRNLSYNLEYRELVAADYGAPTTRKRLFLIARSDGQPIVWPEQTHAKDPENDMLCHGLKPWRTAAECIDWTIPCPSIFERKRPLVENTLRRIARGIQKFLVDDPQPFVLSYYGPKSDNDFRGRSVSEPLPTQTTENRFAIVPPYLVGIDHKGSGSGCAWAPDQPLTTITTENRHALVAAFLAKHYGGVTGQRCDKPIGTITSIDHHSLVHAHLSKFYGTNIGADMRGPLPTITAKGQHIAEVRAFLIKYYGCGNGQSLGDPLHTITTKDRMGLVTVSGEQYQIADIGLRMLQPHELAAAQGFPADYRLPETKSDAVRLIGNSVCPPLAEAIVRANYTSEAEEAAA